MTPRIDGGGGICQPRDVDGQWTTTLVNDSAEVGGGIYDSGTMTVTNSTLANDSSSNTSAAASSTTRH